MARPKPPMYRMVLRKVPPAPRAHAPVVQPPTTSAALVEPTPPKTAAKTATKKTVSKPPLLEWDESMTQKELYRIAKGAGLNVKSKDWKSEIIAEIKKANKTR